MSYLLDKSVNEELKPLFDDWALLAKRKSDIDFKFVIPNYFLVANPEVSIENVIDIISDKLEANGLLKFEGPVHSYFYCLSHDPDEEERVFESFAKFYDIFIKKLCRYGESFGGILAFDITEWIENNACNSKKFLAFLDFMSSIDDETLALFVSRSTNEVKNKEAFQVILTKSRVRSITLGEIDYEDGFEYVDNYFKDRNFKLEEDAIAPMKEIVKFILDVDGNEGLRSLKQLADEVIYDVITGSEKISKIIKTKDLETYTPTGKWGSNFKNSRKKYLGFIGD